MLRYCAVHLDVDVDARDVAFDVVGQIGQQPGLIGQRRCGEISQEDLEGDLGDATLNHIRMEKSLAPVAGFGGQHVPGEAVKETTGRSHGIHHAALGDRRMNVDSADGHRGQVGRERFHVNRVGSRSIQGIADVCGELLQVDMIHAVADFLIAREEDSHRSVWYFRMLGEVGRHLHDDGDAGLVVGAQEGGPIGSDQRGATELLQFRVVRDTDHLAGVARQYDVPARRSSE